VGFGDTGSVVAIDHGIPGVQVPVVGTTSLYGISCPTPTTCEAVWGTGNFPDYLGMVVTMVTGDHAGAVLVPAGGSWLLFAAEVTGPVVVAPWGSLDVESSHVSGTLTASGPSALRLCGTTVDGAVSVAKATGFVLIADSDDDACASNTIGGSLVLRNNTAGVEAIGNRVAGAMVSSGNTGAGPLPEDTAPEVQANGR
jgi:hypothetical protein